MRRYSREEKRRIGASVARLRIARDWTKTELGHRIGHANGGAISQLEAGDSVGDVTLGKVARAFGVDIAELLAVYDPDAGTPQERRYA